MPKNPKNRLDAESVISELEEEVAEEVRLDEHLTPFTLAELYRREFPPARWLVQDLIPLGGVTALTGEPASFKSFLMQYLALCVSTGQPFLGRFNTEKGRVLIIDEENQLRLIRERFEHLHADAAANICFLSQRGIKVDNTAVMDRLAKLIEEIDPTLIVLDSLVRFHSGEENSAKDMARFFEAIRPLVNERRAVVFIHHHRKQFGFGRNSSPQNIRGSSDIPAAIECHLAVDRKTADTLAITQTKLRIQPELPRFKVALVRSEDGALAFTYQGEDDSENEEMLKAQEVLLAVLAEATEPLPVKTLAKLTKLSIAMTRKALKELVDSGEVSVIRGGHNRGLYTLAEKSEPAERLDKEEPSDKEINELFENM